MDVVVLGASGGAGRAIAVELATRGHAVTAVNRRGDARVHPAVRTAAADLSDPAATQGACAGADVVVLAAMPPYHAWAGNFERMLAAVTDAVATADARLVFVDNLYMYGPAEGPMSEESPEHATGKGALRRALAQRVLHDGRFPAVVGRCSDYYGPGGTNSFLHDMFFEPALAGKPMRVLLASDQPHTWHYLPDAARGFATLVERPEGDGRVWILPAAPPLTQDQVAELVNSVLDAPVKVSRITPGLFALASVSSRQAREGRKVAHQFDRPWVVDASAFEATLEPIALSDHRSAIAATLDWLRSQPAASSQRGSRPGAARRPPHRSEQPSHGCTALPVGGPAAGSWRRATSFQGRPLRSSSTPATSPHGPGLRGGHVTGSSEDVVAWQQRTSVQGVVVVRLPRGPGTGATTPWGDYRGHRKRFKNI
jgi:nucleoside-diphosphate-sugar epimerase